MGRRTQVFRWLIPAGLPHFWSRAAIVRFVLVTLSAVLIKFAAQVLSGGSPTPASFALFGIPGMYQRVVTSGFGTRLPSHTALVDLRGGPDLGYTNVCEQRGYLAVVVGWIIEHSRPNVIVIDKWFESDCRANPAGTEALRSTLLEATARNIEVVVGLRIDELEEEISLAEVLGLPQSGGAPLPIRPVFDFGVPGLAECALNFDADLRRVPIVWDFRPDRRQTPCGHSSLSMYAAQKSGILVEGNRIDRFRLDGVHPFTSFLSVDALRQVRVCSDELVPPPSGRVEQDCGAYRTKAAIARLLNGRVVIIGEGNARDLDMHLTPLGLRLPGHYVHANYVESVLDGRLYWPVPPALNLSFTLAILLLLELVRSALPRNEFPWRFIAWMLLAVAAAAGLDVLLVHFFGCLMDPQLAWLGLMVQSLEVVGDWVIRRFGDRPEGESASSAAS